MSEMFNLNLIEGVYNKFGNEIERIYNNRNEIIWELDYGSNDYFWVEPDESMLGTGSNYIGFYQCTDTTDEQMPQNAIQYSLDGVKWEYMPYNSGEIFNKIEITRKTYFRYVKNSYTRHRIVGIHNISSSSENIRLDCNVGGSLHKYMNDVYYNDNLFKCSNYDFNSFFKGLAIIDASKLKVDYFKNKTARYQGYMYMFANQTLMKYPPILDFEIVEESACEYMFSGCSSLLSAPELHATTLAKGCYNSMFQGCTSLVTAPELPATTLYEYCYMDMLNGCTSLVNAPELPATTLAEHCYEGMLKGCTSLVNAPALHATTLAKFCYMDMLNGCTSLVNAPELTAATLYTYCYYRMFYGCTSLVNAPELPAAILVQQCYDYMFNNCSSLSNITCYAENPTLIVNWVKGVKETGTFNKRRGVEWPTGTSGIPTNWTVNEI